MNAPPKRKKPTPPVCGECERPMTLDTRGLCPDCGADPAVQARHQEQAPPVVRLTLHPKQNGPLPYTHMILLAAADLDRFRASITIWTLAYRCWQRWPDVFGWGGMEPTHPDTHKVRYSLADANGALRAWLRRVRENEWELTPAGYNAAERLQQAKAGA